MDTRPPPFDLDACFTHHDPRKGRQVAFPVAEFWRWGFSNIQENVIRGILAEYVVARALGIQLMSRQSWDEADLITAGGCKIEVKSSAFVQAWDQGGKVSKVVFNNLKTRLWIPLVGEASEPDYHADLYIFCIQAARSREAYDPLDLDQWEFWVLSRSQVASGGTRSLSHARLVKLAGAPVKYARLADTVHRVASEAGTVL